MKCRTVRKHLVDLLDVAPEPALQASLKEHLATCPLCLKEYQELRQTMVDLAPEHRVNASPAFKETVMSRIIEMNGNGANARREARPWRPLLAAGVAVAVLLVATFGLWLIQTRGTEPLTAFNVLGQAAHAMSNLQSVHISARMRTIPHDNFDMIVLDRESVPVDLWKQFGAPPQWRVEKSGRVAVMDGESSLLWIKSANTAARGGARSGFIGWLAPMMDVDHILESERELARAQGSVLTLEYATGSDGAEELVVYVEAVAQGDYTNDWLLNKSVSDSANLRVYRLDADTLYLKGLQIFVHTDEGDICVFETTAVEYDTGLDASLFALDLPDDVSWYGEPAPAANDTVDADLSPDKVARAFFEACGREDWATVERYYPISPVPQRLKDAVGGLELLSIGTPFKSGRYPGWFIPYEIRFRNGGTKKMNLAVRNDNPAKRYIVDGGL
jgi:hypothetical protein